MGIHQNGFKLRYLPDAYAWVDPIKTVHELFGQRKRWNNGSWFAFDKVKRTLTEEENCSVTWFFLSFQMLFLAFNSILAWFSPVVYMLTIHLSV
jgi:chitin synthase